MRVLTILAAAGAGAALAYLFDPQHGRRRRDKAYAQWKSLQERAPKIAKDLQKRANGVVAEAKRLTGAPSQH